MLNVPSDRHQASLSTQSQSSVDQASSILSELQTSATDSPTPKIHHTMVIKPQINSTSPEEINACEYTKHIKEFFN